MSDFEGKKAVVFFDKSSVEVPFKNYSAAGIQDASPIIKKDIDGVLIVFNAFDELLIVNDAINSNAKKLIDGLSSEISLAYVEGWQVNYYTSFKEYAKYGEDKLPREFTASEDDKYFNKSTYSKMIEEIFSYMPTLKTVRLVGIISKKELDCFERDLKNENLNIEIDSPYLLKIECDD